MLAEGEVPCRTEFPSTSEGSKQFGRGRCIDAMGVWWVHAACAGTGCAVAPGGECVKRERERLK